MKKKPFEKIAGYLLIAFLLLTRVSFAHVGSSGVIVQKQVGKYSLLVSVQPPDVVPGTAIISVFVEQGRAKSVRVRPVYFSSGDKGAPLFDELKQTGTQRFEGDEWLMTAGSSSIELQIDGPDGKQQVVVPVMAVATALRDMPAGTGWGLAAMGLLLIVMLVTIIGASNADGIALPNQLTGQKLRHRRLVGMGVGLVVLTLLLTGWRSWWVSSAERYRSVQLYRPTRVEATVQPTPAGRELALKIDTSGANSTRRIRRQFSYLVPDHGKLMHTFLVRIPGLDAFAHLHPTRQDTLHFNAALPALPAGNYLIFSDIVYRSGFAETLTDTLRIDSATKSAAQVATDADDSWLATEPMGIKAGSANIPHLDNDMVTCGKPSATCRLSDGSTMLWMDKPEGALETGKLYTLKFAVADAQGKAAPLEPYLGMGGHAVILRSDGTVYIHLHPVGTYSMAAEHSLERRFADTSRTVTMPLASRFSDSIDTYISRLRSLPVAERDRLLMASTPGMNHTMKVNNMADFPYAFPRAGHYRIWVQVKRNGQVLTGVFDTQVNDPLL